MKLSCFITGTDTDVGKTLVAAALLQLANSKSLSTAAIKPVAAGCEPQLINDETVMTNADALLLQQFSSLALDYHEVNPVALESAIAPHIAAAQQQRTISIDRLAGFCRGVLSKGADLTVVEGAGGWRVPVSARETLPDLVKQLRLPVVLVVGLRLGCLNHALLSAEAIVRDGLPLAGWVANGIDPEMSVQSENIATLKHSLPAPCLGIVPHLPTDVRDETNRVAAMAASLDIESLIERLSVLQGD